MDYIGLLKFLGAMLSPVAILGVLFYIFMRYRKNKETSTKFEISQKQEVRGKKNFGQELTDQ